MLSRFFLQISWDDALVFVGGILSLHFLAGMAFEKALVVGVIPFIIPDLGKIMAISFISRPYFNALKIRLTLLTKKGYRVVMTQYPFHSLKLSCL